MSDEEFLRAVREVTARTEAAMVSIPLDLAIDADELREQMRRLEEG